MAITDKLSRLANVIRKITKNEKLLTIDEMTDLLSSMENNPNGIQDVILTDSSLVFPPGVYAKTIRVHLKDWKWNSLDLQNGVITEATVNDIQEGG